MTLAEYVARQQARVDQALERWVPPASTLPESIHKAMRYSLFAGGKRIRPSLLLLAAKSLGYHGQGMVRLGAVVEMVHTATLVHDDIIDGADTRRGRPSANTTWGNSKCVLAGDWLYMQAFHIALQERKFKVLDLLIGLTQQMVEGELLQIQKLGKAVSEAEYYDLIFRKTACLFSVSMRLGAVLAGATEAEEAALAGFFLGRNIEHQAAHFAEEFALHIVKVVVLLVESIRVDKNHLQEAVGQILHRERKEIADAAENLPAFAVGVRQRDEVYAFAEIRLAEKILVAGRDVAQLGIRPQILDVRLHKRRILADIVVHLVFGFDDAVGDFFHRPRLLISRKRFRCGRGRCGSHGPEPAQKREP